MVSETSAGSKREAFVLAILLVVFNAFDWATTFLAVQSNSDVVSEMNPFLAAWIDGPFGFLLKTFGVGVIGWMLYKRGSVVILRVVVAIYGGVVAWNTFALGMWG